MLTVGVADRGEVGVAGLGAGDDNGHVAMRGGIPVGGGEVAIDVDTGECHTAAAEDGALEGAAVHEDADIALHTAVGVVGVEVVTSATEDVAVVGGGALCADDAAVDHDADAVEDVAIGAAAEEGTPDAATHGGGVPVGGLSGWLPEAFGEGHGEVRLIDVTEGLAILYRVGADTAAGSVDVGVVAVVVERSDDGVAADLDVADAAVALGGIVKEEVASSGITFHPAGGGHIAAAVDAVHNLAAGDLDVGVAVDAAGLLGRHHRDDVAGGGDEGGVVDVREALVVTVAAAEDGAVVVVVFGEALRLVVDDIAEAAAVDGDVAVFLDDTAGAAAEGVAHEAATVDDDAGVTHTTHVDPVPVVGTILFHIALAAAVDVAGAGVVETAERVDEGPGTAVMDTFGAELIGGTGVGVAVNNDVGVAGFPVIIVVVGVLGAGAVGSDVAVGVPPADGRHLAAGVDVGHDARSCRRRGRRCS